jgi:hypothetical protein
MQQVSPQRPQLTIYRPFFAVGLQAAVLNIYLADETRLGYKCLVDPIDASEEGPRGIAKKQEVLKLTAIKIVQNQIY